MSRSLLVVAGGASGDRAGAAVVRHLTGVRVFGFGGGALEAEGIELLADLRDTASLGFADARRTLGMARAYATLRAAIARRKPTAALLVTYTKPNARLARSLWTAGTPVLWYGAPPLWAWRATNSTALGRHVDRMALMLPFEEKIWRDLGVDAHYVGHPALEERCGDRVSARELFGMTPRAWAIAILPGSHAEEVRRLLPEALGAYQLFRREYASVDARVLLASTLDPVTRAWARALAASSHVEVVDVDARAGLAYALPAFDVALSAGGTVSLECAIARVVPIVCHRVGLAARSFARAFSKAPYVGLPNIVLGRTAFPELVQRQASAPQIADVLGRVLTERETFLRACADVETALGGRNSASANVARMLQPWLEA